MRLPYRKLTSHRNFHDSILVGDLRRGSRSLAPVCFIAGRWAFFGTALLDGLRLVRFLLEHPALFKGIDDLLKLVEQL